MCAHGVGSCLCLDAWWREFKFMLFLFIMVDVSICLGCLGCVVFVCVLCFVRVVFRHVIDRTHVLLLCVVRFCHSFSLLTRFRGFSEPLEFSNALFSFNFSSGVGQCVYVCLCVFSVCLFACVHVRFLSVSVILCLYVYLKSMFASALCSFTSVCVRSRMFLVRYVFSSFFFLFLRVRACSV